MEANGQEKVGGGQGGYLSESNLQAMEGVALSPLLITDKLSSP